MSDDPILFLVFVGIGAALLGSVLAPVDPWTGIVACAVGLFCCILAGVLHVLDVRSRRRD